MLGERMWIVKAIVAVALCLTTLLAACAGQPTEVPPATVAPAEPTVPPTETPETEEKTVLRFGASGSLSTLDVTMTNSAWDEQIGQWMFCRLVWYDKTMTDAVPQLAESWEISDDGLTYVFKIREGAKFHNGREVTAEDIVYTWDRVLELSDKGRGDEQLADVESYEATGEYEFTVKLARPSPIFLPGLAQWALGIVPEENADELETNPVSCGPYQFVEWVPEDHASFVKFEDYWDKDALDRLPDEMIFIPVKEELTRLSMLQTGQIDVAQAISAENWEMIGELPDIHLVEQELSSSYLVYIFQTESGPTSDPKLREAISYAFDREAVVQTALFGYGDIDCNYIPRGHWAYTEVDCPSYDPGQAKELLEESDYSGEKIRIITYDNPLYVPAAEVLQQYLIEIGIDAEVVVAERGVWIEDAWKGGDFEITIAALTREPDPDGLMSSVFREGGGNNSARYYNPTIEELFDRGKSTSDREERKQIYAEIVRILVDDLPAIKVASVFRAAAANDKVQGLYVQPKGFPAWELLSFNP